MVGIKVQWAPSHLELGFSAKLIQGDWTQFLRKQSNCPFTFKGRTFPYIGEFLSCLEPLTLSVSDLLTQI